MANLVPLLGVVFWKWKPVTIASLFWLETFIIVFENVPRLALAGRKSLSWSEEVKLSQEGCIGILFTTFFTGNVVLISGMVFLGGFVQPGTTYGFEGTGLPLLCLAASHAVCFFTEYVGKQEYVNATRKDLLLQPFRRSAIMFCVGIPGCLVMELLRAPGWSFALLIAVKIAADLGAHLRERETFGRNAPQ